MAALEASQVDYRAAMDAIDADFAVIKTELADFRRETRAASRSLHEQLAEIKDLIIGRGIIGRGDGPS
jgi:hypothetical protein